MEVWNHYASDITELLTIAKQVHPNHCKDQNHPSASTRKIPFPYFPLIVLCRKYRLNYGEDLSNQKKKKKKTLPVLQKAPPTPNRQARR